MNATLKNKIILELSWWAFTAVLLVILLLPIFINKINFPFLNYNIFFIITAVSFSRLLFQLKHSFVAFNLVLKFVLMFLSVVVIMLVFRGLSLYNIYSDEHGHYFLYEHLPLTKRYNLSAFVKWEYFFFGITAFVASIAMPFRLLVSIFRVRNRGEE